MAVPKPLVKHWMSVSPISIDSHTTVAKAHDLMAKLSIRHLPVVENEKLVGIISLGDVRESGPSDVSALSIYELNYLLANTEVKEAMTADPFWVSPEDGLSIAARLMLDHKIGGLPVVDAGKLVGMLTESDIFRAVVDVFEGE